MLFTSTVFLIFFLPIVLSVNFILPNRFRNLFLLLASILFYAWGEIYYFVIMIVSICCNYILTRAMAQFPAGPSRRSLLIAGVGINLSLLGWFKYANFFADNLNIVLEALSLGRIEIAPVHLPLGISFFTFQSLSYVVDVYRGRVQVQKNFIRLALYVSLFPQLIAGPIVRYIDIAREIVSRKFDLDQFSYGVRRFIIGMGKKMILANPMGEVVDTIFALPPEQWTTPMAWLGVICFSLQVYFDFSGYSDMAIGLGRMMGFTFLENFNYPYISQSLREFWQRWHISLSTWFRDYLYIPLGGNRGSVWRTQLNLWVVYVLCGFWHGASWNFVIWGAIHGFFMVLERAGLDRVLHWMWRPFRHLYMMLVYNVAFAFFLTKSIPDALVYLSVMVGLTSGEAPKDIAMTLFAQDKQIIFTLGILASLPWRSIFEGVRKQKHLLVNGSRSDVVIKLKRCFGMCARATHVMFLISVLLISMMYIAAGTYNPFIYFRF